jgi:hypothetical protein
MRLPHYLFFITKPDNAVKFISLLENQKGNEW